MNRKLNGSPQRRFYYTSKQSRVKFDCRYKIDFDQLIGLRSFFSARNTTCGQSKTIEKITIHLREQSVTFVRGKKVKVCVCVRVLMIDRLFFFSIECYQRHNNNPKSILDTMTLSDSFA